jgi:hypothetical protein
MVCRTLHAIGGVTESEVANVGSRKREASPDLEAGEHQKAKRTDPGVETPHDPGGKHLFGPKVRTSVLNDPVASPAKDGEIQKATVRELQDVVNKALAEKCHEWETRVENIFERLWQKKKREITLEAKVLIDEVIYGYLFEEKNVTITKHITKQFHVGSAGSN